MALFVVAILALVTGCERTEGQLLRSFKFTAGDVSRHVDLPVHLNAELPQHVVVYRLSTDVAVDPGLRDRDLDLVIPSLSARVALRAGGTLVPPVDKTSREETHRHIGPHRWAVPRSAIVDGRLALELDVTYAWTQSAWLDTAPRLVPSGAETAVTERNRLLNERGGWFGLVGLSQMGLTFLALFFWDRRHRSYLWFAIQALTASYYPAYVLGLTIPLGPAAEYLLLAHCLSIAPIISVYYTHEFFERGKPHRAWLVLFAIAIVLPLPALLNVFVDSAYGTPGVIACVGAAIAYQIVVGVRLVGTYADRRIGLFFLCCWLALGGSAWVDLWAWIGGGEVLDGARPACIGLGLFGIFQSMLLSRSHFRSLQEAENLNATLRGRLRDLEHRQAEIESLNEELRQQVGRRSANILAALTGVGSTQVSAQLEPGEIVEDRYRVIGALGSGGMGTVYEVERLHDHRRLALKVARETRGLDLARLAREAQVATRVRHPNVVAVVDTDISKAGQVYIVMDLVEGCSLADCEGRHDVVWCLKLLAQILEGIGALHAQGIIHRDLKPENVLIAGDVEQSPHAKITDFGISRGLADPDASPLPVQKPAGPEPPTISVFRRAEPTPDPTDSDLAIERGHVAHTPHSSTPQLTRAGSISGTPSYVAPELARTSGQLTPAVDVFSFGVVAYRLLTGVPPHTEAPLLARLDGREPSPHVPVAMRCPGLPPRVAQAIDRCLSFTPEGRPGTPELIRVFADAIETTAPELFQADG